jgi:hypothetical protein
MGLGGGPGGGAGGGRGFGGAVAGGPPAGFPGGQQGAFPGAGQNSGAQNPGSQNPGAQNPGGGFGGGVDASVVAYLQAHQGSARYAVAVADAQTAGPYIMAGLSVLPMGGFSGQVPFPTLAQFQSLVAAGQVRYVLSGGRGGRGGPAGTGQGGSGVSAWVTQNCTSVSAVSGLYDCAAG